VNTGDIIFADFDGIVVIPRGLEHKVCELACNKAGKESLTRQGLEAGKTLREMYDKYKVL
jgi:regulator of RNase E activity RraA